LIARRPIRALWLIDAPPVKLERWVAVLFVVLGVVPVWLIARGLDRQQWPIVAYGLVAIIGAFGAAYALRAWSAPTFKALRGSMLWAGSIGIALLVLTAVARGGLTRLPEPVPQGSLIEFGVSFVQYVAVSFAMEEVFFRGALDSYLNAGEDDQVSAVFIAALWGLWHLPFTFATAGFAAIPGLLGVHIAVGVPLALWFRKGRNLAVPAITHSFINAVRNAAGLQG
jgi:membrane protease YdiL (CAAX protease family)